MIRDQLSAGTHAAIVVDGKRVGIVQIEETAESISLSQIEILPGFQDQGIGTAVISMLLTKADTEGKRVALRVFTRNFAGPPIVRAHGLRCHRQIGVRSRNDLYARPGRMKPETAWSVRAE